MRRLDVFGAGMRRREFIFGLGGAIGVWPVAARAQPSVMPVVGTLNSGVVQPRRDQMDGFHRGLKELGLVPGENVAILQRGAEDRYDRLPALAAELVRERVAVIASLAGRSRRSQQRPQPLASPSCSRAFPTRSAAASSQASTAPVAI